MPAKVLPDIERFRRFEEYMTREGFRRISDVEFANSFERLGLQAPRFRPGREAGFIFSANGLTVFVWTTFLSRLGYARDEDAGWVVIVENDNPKYYSHPMMRTEGFLRRLFKHAIIAKERVLNRPLCPTCRAHMDIAMGKGLKSRYWKCNGRSRWHRTQMLSWDCGLSQDSIDYLTVQRNIRRHSRKRREKAGQAVGQAMLTRRPWKTTRPENRT